MALPLNGKGRVAGHNEQPSGLCKGRDDVVRDPVSEVLLLRNAAQIRERENRDRGLVGLVRARSCRLRLANDKFSRLKGIDLNRAGDVLEAVLSSILERQGQLALKFVEVLPETPMPPGSAMPSRRAGNIHAVTENVSVFGQR